VGQGEAAPFGCPSGATADSAHQHQAEAKSKSGRELGEDFKDFNQELSNATRKEGPA